MENEEARIGEEKMNKADNNMSAFLHAFTFIEILVVLLVISILAGITFPVSKYVTRRAREANQKIFIEKIKGGLEDYRAAYGEYPITPIPGPFGEAINKEDVKRHYDTEELRTRCYFTSNSTYRIFNLANSTDLVEHLVNMGKDVDYSLTYPLMIKQQMKGARPFVEFKEITIAYFVSKDKVVLSDESGDTFTEERWIKTALDGVKRITSKGIRGNAIDRPVAIDPVSLKQWKYTSTDGATYSLTTNSF